MRPKSTACGLPPRMLRRTKRLASGKVWEGFYYNGRDESGKRVEIPLGTNLNEAKRKAELECKPAPTEIGLMDIVFDRYMREIIPTKAPKTQHNNQLEIAKLRSVFGAAPVESITPQHIAQYRESRMGPIKTLKDGTVIPARKAMVFANRELALFSHIYNKAREWGYTAKTNPCAGVSKNRETPRDFYVDSDIWDAVYANGADELKDAMDLAYLTGQRPADVLKMMEIDVRNGALEVKQNKTKKHLRIMLDNDQGIRSELGLLLDRIRARPRKIRSLYLIATPSGVPLNKGTLRLRFESAKNNAVATLLSEGSSGLAERVMKFQFRDIRPKAASEIADITAASKLLGHSSQEITKSVYRRVGERVMPTK